MTTGDADDHGGGPGRPPAADGGDVLRLSAPAGQFVTTLVAGAGMAALSAFVVTRSDEVALIVVGGCGVLLFGAGALWSARRVLRRGPVLEIDRDGIVDRASAVAVGRIGWHEIADVSIGAVSGQRFLTVHVGDEAALLRRLPWPRRVVARMNRRLGFGLVNLPESMLALPLEDVAELVRRGVAAAAPRDGGDGR